VIRPIWLPLDSVNHSAPSGPAAIPTEELLAVGTVNSLVTTPSGVIRPILLPENSVNHSAPSGPAAMPVGALPAVGTAYSVMVCAAAGIGCASAATAPRPSANTARRFKCVNGCCMSATRRLFPKLAVAAWRGPSHAA
jgi:hypothetical protein